ncbi:MAG: hypothetical protein AAFY99_03740 [Pseudomonadota bacterium]
MSNFRILEADFFLKKGHKKSPDKHIIFLLKHGSRAGPAHHVAHYVFLHSAGRRHEVWQITDLRVPWGHIGDVVAVADELFASNVGSDRYLKGRLFTFHADRWFDEVKDKVIVVLTRARWPHEIARKCVRDGLIFADEWDTAIEALNAEIEANKAAALAQQQANPSQVVWTARELGLHPMPAGNDHNKWTARCPKGNHPIFIGTTKDKWFCGWCGSHGGADELKTFHAETAKKTGHSSDAG